MERLKGDPWWQQREGGLVGPTPRGGGGGGVQHPPPPPPPIVASIPELKDSKPIVGKVMRRFRRRLLIRRKYHSSISNLFRTFRYYDMGVWRVCVGAWWMVMERSRESELRRASGSFSPLALPILFMRLYLLWTSNDLSFHAPMLWTSTELWDHLERT
jgi:hypothetical protein